MRLIRADARLLDAAIEGDQALSDALGHAVAPGWAASFPGALPATRQALKDPEGDAWGTRLFVAGRPAELVGWGGFKGPPADGVAEVGYEIAECRQGRGLATAATLALLDEAWASEDVTTVIAHTLPERNASNRVLEKAGFSFDGEAREHGEPVWRFRAGRGRQS